jgi:hypothetical protein
MDNTPAPSLHLAQEIGKRGSDPVSPEIRNMGLVFGESGGEMDHGSHGVVVGGVFAIDPATVHGQLIAAQPLAQAYMVDTRT